MCHCHQSNKNGFLCHEQHLCMVDACYAKVLMTIIKKNNNLKISLHKNLERNENHSAFFSHKSF